MICRGYAVAMAALMLVGGLPTPARGASVTITVDPGQGAQLANQMNISVDELSNQLAAEIEKAFNVAEPAEYVRALTDAQAFSNRGLGVDYASNPTLFVVGAAGNFAMSLGDEGLGERYEDRPVLGAAPNASLMAGLNLGMLGLDMVTLYANFFAQSATLDQFSGNILNSGVHAQFKFFRPEGDALELLFQWGGFDVTSGVEYSRLKLRLKDELDTELPLAEGIEAVFAGTGTYDITTTAVTVPIELTTNFRTLYVLTLFCGVGFDVQLGSGEMSVGLDGDLSAPDPTSTTGGTIDVGSASVEVSETAEPSGGKVRFLGGVQVNISVVKLFVQANVIPDRSVSAAAGLRVAW